LFEVPEDFGSMAFGFYGGPNGFNRSRLSDQERAPHDAQEFAPHEGFLLPGAEGLDGLVVGIAEQRKVQLLFAFKRSLGFHRIGAHAEDGDPEFIELPFCVTKLGRFDGSTGSIGFGIQKEQDALAAKIGEGDLFAVVRGQTEAGSFIADFEHPGTSTGEA
jgi:hypothetical protein